MQSHVNATVEKGIYLLSCTFSVSRKYHLIALGSNCAVLY